ncbi:MAG: family 78 glycoside hydrolase catalytic domain [Puniceicoccaceae bacterium]
MKALIALIIFVGLVAPVAGSSPLQVIDLRCDDRTDPIEIDNPQPVLRWKLLAQSTTDRSRSQSAYRILVATSLERLQADEADLWDSQRIQSSNSITVRYEGQPLTSRQACFWKVMVWDEAGRPSEWSKPAYWKMALLDASDWEGSKWIGLAKDTRDSPHAEREYMFMPEPEMKRSYPSPLLRKEIFLTHPVRRAFAYVAAVGYGELYLNGEKVGDAVLDPAQTNYDKQTFYTVHDLSDRLVEGSNAIGLWLGNGFFGQNVAWQHDFNYGQPRARTKVFVEYTDGSTEVFGTDCSWHATTGPIVFDNVYWGETYDARKEVPGWASSGCDTSTWQQAVVLEEPCRRENLRAQDIPPIRVKERFQPVSIKAIEGGKYIVDFGRNIAGWVEIQVEQEAGDIITILAGERMEPDGVTVNTLTTGGAPGRVQEMIYIAKGEGTETWSPRFSYHGFQYVEISGLRTEPTTDSLTAVLVHNDLPETGSFECSEELVNRQYTITRNTLEANWHSIPEDCPAREKCGWLGDAHATVDISLYGYDTKRFLAKYCRDIEDSLVANDRYQQFVGVGKGVPPRVAPGKRATDRPAEIDWGVAYVLLPWRLYLHTGDPTVFERHYPALKNFIAYYESMREPGQILANGLGDWCPPLWDRRLAPEYMDCHPHVSGTAFYYAALRIVASMAQLQEEDEFSEYCLLLANEVRDAFNKTYLEDIPGTDTKFYGSQTATIMALQMGMVPEDQLESVIDGLVHDIETVNSGQHSVGIHGLRHLYTVLADFGHEELVARMLLDRDFPGPGYLADYGFSTWPERQFNWDEEPRYRNSMNHPMQGGFAAFFYEGLGGIRPSEEGPGYRVTEFRPRLTLQWDWARVLTASPYGPIESRWKQTIDGLEWKVHVPVNAEGIVYLPAIDARTVLESGIPLGEADGIMSIEKADDARMPCLKVRLGSGHYCFGILR